MRRLTALLSALLALVLLAPTAARADGADRDLLYRKHVDAAHIAWDAAHDRLAVRVIDVDRARPAEEVYVRLGPDADATGREVSRTKVPRDPAYSFLGSPGDIVWSAPQEYLDGWRPVWAGFGAGALPKDVASRVLPETMRLELVGVDGPGTVNVFSVSPHKVHHLFSSRGDQHRVRPMAPGSHTHATWTFSEPGRYDLRWKAVVDTRDGAQLTSEVTPVTWLVGPDSAVGLPEGTTPGATITRPAEDVPLSDAPQPEPVEDTSVDPTEGFDCEHHDSGAVSVRGSWSGAFEDDGYPEAPEVSVTDDSGRDRRAEHAVVDVTSSRPAPKADGDEFASVMPAGSTVWHLPGKKGAGPVWQTLDTKGIDRSSLSEVSLRLDAVKGPSGGAVLVTDSSSGSPVTRLSHRSGSLATVMRTSGETTPLEMWFTKPGIYQVEWALNIVAKGSAGDDVKQNYDMFTTWYAVGPQAVARACAASKPTPTPSAPAPAPEPSGAPRPSDTPSASTSPSPDPTIATDPVRLDSGHVDVFRVGRDAKGLSLLLQEDVTGSHVLRRPEDVTLVVKEEALTDIPASLPGAPRGYVLPLT